MLLIMAIAVSAPWAVQEIPRGPGQGSVRAAVARAEVLLSAVDERLRDDPSSVPLRLERLRHLHVLGVERRAYLDEGDAEIARVRALSPHPDLWLAATLTAFSGAFEVVRAKHATWPPTRLSHVKEGLRRLDTAVQAQAGDPEIRFLRLTSCVPLPFFFNRGDSVREDARALAALLTSGQHSLSDDALVTMATFLLDEVELEGSLRQRIAALLAAGAVGGGS